MTQPHEFDADSGEEWDEAWEDDDPSAPLGSDDALSPPSPWPRRWLWTKRIAGALSLLFIVTLGWLLITAPLSKSLEPLAPPRLTLLAADGQEIAQNGAIIEAPVQVAKLPPHVKQAFMAIEDRRFETHWGVDPRGLARAFWNNLTGGPVQGGSTITQQLAKITFLSSERSYTRKAREMLIAFWLEARLSKDQILERYLSNVYFGDNIYGLRAASLHYFYRQPERLTLPQAAMLAGLVQAPSRLAPTRNMKGARKRAQMVLDAMVTTGAISEETAAATVPASIDQRFRPTLPTGTYFADWAMKQARDVAGDSYGTAKVKTTLDARLQRAARNAINRAPLGNAQVALVAMRPNGEVVAMLGGRNYEASPFNRATQALRQPGSTFKLFVYTAALREGMSPDDMVDDSEITTGNYRPKNSDGRYRGQISLERAFAASSNTAAVRLYTQLGSDKVIRAARDLGIKSALAKGDPSLALGTSGVTLLELTAAYAGVAANRWPVEPVALKQEEQGFLESLLSPQRSFGSDVEDGLLTLLKANVNQGTGSAARLAIPAYGKTGTTQDSRDALFIGFAGDLVVGVWVGRDDNQPLKGVSGGGIPARIWRDFMSQAVKGARPAVPKPKPGKTEPDLPALPPLDLDIDAPEIELGNDSSVTFKSGIGGVKLDVRLDKDGVSVNPGSKDKP